jgi:hypothetical protein
MQPGVEEKEVGQNSTGKKDTGEGKQGRWNSEEAC